MECSLSRRDTFFAWWRGYRDAKRDIAVDSNMNFQQSNIKYLYSRHHDLVIKCVGELRNKSNGILNKYEKPQIVRRPPESHSLGQAGRDWAIYSYMVSEALIAIQEVIDEAEFCQIIISREREHAQEIVTKYVASVSQYHQRRIKLKEWEISVPPFSKEETFTRKIHERALVALEYFDVLKNEGMK